MKIGDIWQPQTIQGDPENLKPKAGAPEGDFAALLRDEITGAGGAVPSSDVSELTPTAVIPCITEIAGNTQASDGIAAIEDVIAKLQSLEQALQGDASPKQVDLIVAKIGDAAAKLREKTDSLPGNDSLRDISEEVSVAAYMESVKWRRGDYL
ncbi:MAG: hypothetical protein WAW37_17405 [Syntrophobacteraceae bacterium]